MIYGEATETAENIIGAVVEAMQETATCINRMKARAEKAEAELAALGRDARLLVSNNRMTLPPFVLAKEIKEAEDRILKATEPR